jgi:hypothetical protein
VRDVADRRAGELLHGAPDEARERRVDLDEAGVEAGDRDADRRVVERTAEAGLGVAQPLARLARGVDVLADDVDELGVAVDDEAQQEPPPRAAGPQANLDLGRRALAPHQRGPALAERSAIVRVQQRGGVRRRDLAHLRADEPRQRGVGADQPAVEADHAGDVRRQLEEALAERARGDGSSCGA